MGLDIYKALSLNVPPSRRAKTQRGGFGTGQPRTWEYVNDYVSLTVAEFRKALPDGAKFRKISDTRYSVTLPDGRVVMVGKSQYSNRTPDWRLVDPIWVESQRKGGS